MVKNIISLAVLVFAISACSSKSKNTEVEEVGPGIIENDLTTKSSGSDGGNIPGLYSINFDYDKISLSDDSKEKLSSNIKWLNDNPKTPVQIEGHCDSRGSIEYNLTLGERRAQTVKTYLVSNGVDGNRLSILSMGEEKLINDEDNDSAHSANRRANFVPQQ